MSLTTTARRFIDIGANLTDPMFQGLYHGNQKHSPDLPSVLQRAWNNGVEKIIITGTNLEESKKAVALAGTDERLFCTVGCHPTNCQEMENSQPERYLKDMLALIAENNEQIVAVGEMGLDYDRLQFCAKDVQLKFFELQLQYFGSTGLPLFLHCRNAAADLLSVLSRNRRTFKKGVVHSFDGSLDEAQAIINLGLLIGINGCSLKTEANLQTVAAIPSDKILLETDCPWCEIRPTHSGFNYVKTEFKSVKKEKWKPDTMVKGRNEPSSINCVLEVMAGVKKEDPNVLCQTIWENTLNMFFPKKT